MTALIVRVQKFDEANRPAIPFTLRIEDLNLDHEIVEEQKLSNWKTNEELSVSHNVEYEGCIGTEIKRMAIKKKNSQPKP